MMLKEIRTARFFKMLEAQLGDVHAADGRPGDEGYAQGLSFLLPFQDSINRDSGIRQCLTDGDNAHQGSPAHQLRHRDTRHLLQLAVRQIHLTHRQFMVGRLKMFHLSNATPPLHQRPQRLLFVQADGRDDAFPGNCNIHLVCLSVHTCSQDV